MKTLNNVEDTSYILLRTHDLTQEEYNKIVECAKKVLREEYMDRIVQELRFTDWLSLK